MRPESRSTTQTGKALERVLRPLETAPTKAGIWPSRPSWRASSRAQGDPRCAFRVGVDTFQFDGERREMADGPRAKRSMVDKGYGVGVRPPWSRRKKLVVSILMLAPIVVVVYLGLALHYVLDEPFDNMADTLDAFVVPEGVELFDSEQNTGFLSSSPVNVERRYMMPGGVPATCDGLASLSVSSTGRRLDCSIAGLVDPLGGTPFFEQLIEGKRRYRVSVLFFGDSFTVRLSSLHPE